MSDRRGFLELLATAAVATMWRGTPQCAGANGGKRLIERIGVQLYTVRDAMARDVPGTLARVAEIGYDEVEFAGYFDRSPRELRTILDDVGLAAPAAHIPLEQTTAGFDRVLEAAGVLGHGYLVVPWIPVERRRTLEDYRGVARQLNEAGERSAAAGIRLAYHNHDFEFEPVEGRVPFDVLLAETDPSKVAFELDLYWITKAGADPLDYFARYQGRFPLVHVKDADASPERRMVEVGSGAIDWRRIFARADEAGIRHYFVEHDQPADPFGSIEAGYEYLQGLRR